MKKSALIFALMLCIAAALASAANLDYMTGTPAKSANVTFDAGSVTLLNDGNDSQGFGCGGSTTGWLLGGFINITFTHDWNITSMQLINANDGSGLETSVSMRLYVGETLVNSTTIPMGGASALRVNITFNFTTVQASSVRLAVSQFSIPGSGGFYVNEWIVRGNNDTAAPTEGHNLSWGAINPVNNTHLRPSNYSTAPANISFNVTVNSTAPFNVSLYINNTLNETKQYTNGTNIAVNFSVNISAVGRYDYYFNATLPANTSISPAGYFYTDPYNSLSWGAITPTNNTAWNPSGNISINTTVNSTAETFTISLYINNTLSETKSYTNGTNIAIQFSRSLTGSGRYDYYFNATLPANISISPKGYFYLDLVAPTITINPSNGWTATNYSTISPYGNTLPINITFTDDRDLYSYYITLAHLNGTLRWSNTQDINGTSYTAEGTLGIGNLSADTYIIKVWVWDSHTATEIKEDYKVAKEKDKLIYNTAEGNDITIEAEGANTADTKKLTDRYDFSFTYDKKARGTLVYFVGVGQNQKITYRQGSTYQAHFVVMNKDMTGGNWIDFEGLDAEKYTVEKISATRYKITFYLKAEKSSPELVTFSSLGALNMNHAEYRWYRGEAATTSNSITLINTTESFALQVTNSSLFISNITARFFYNGIQHTATAIPGAGFFIFNSTATTPAATGIYVYYWSWNISVIQGDGSVINTSFTGNQTVVSGQINVTFLDERNQSIIDNETLNVYIVDRGYSYTTDTGYILMGNLSPGVNYIEAESTNYPRRGYYVTITNYSVIRVNAYLLSSASPAQEVIFTVQDSSFSRIPNVKLSFYKQINITYLNVAQLATDYAGQAALYLDSSNTYRIIIDASAAGFPVKTIELRPIRTTYSFTLDIASAGFSNVLENISYSIVPTGRVFNVSNAVVNKTLYIYAPNGDLEYFGVRLFGHNYTCIPASCTVNVTTSPSGGSAGVGIIGNVSGPFKVSIFMKRIGYDEIELERDVAGDPRFVDALVASSRSLWEMMKMQKSSRSIIMRSLIAVFVTIAAVGTAAELGIVGVPLVVITAFGLGFFTIMGFIPYVVGFVTVILGGLVYARFGGGAD